MNALSQLRHALISLVVVGVAGVVVGFLPAIVIAAIWPDAPWDQISVAVAVPISLFYLLMRTVMEAWPGPPKKAAKTTAWSLVAGALILLALLLLPSILVYAALGLWWAVNGAAITVALIVVFLMASVFVSTVSVGRVMPRAVLATLTLVACYVMTAREQMYHRHPIFLHRSAH